MSTPINVTITKKGNIVLEKIACKIHQFCMYSPNATEPCGLHCPQVLLSKDLDGHQYLHICQNKTIKINTLVIEGNHKGSI